MKALVKVFSILVLLLGCFPVFSTHSFAADDTGKMLLKTDRIGQDSTIGNENHKETELEKVAPELFKEQTRAAINTKQLESEKATENLEQKLFVQPSKPNTALKDTKNTLFSSNYTVQYAEASAQDTKKDGGLISDRIIPALIGLVAACCGGIFVMMRKMLE
ncbi:type VII secretion protein EssA [Neobacillus drentensis]|uniref:type VII secretion protein EssA n=1 Tax=Neobacillus drentensis TaxID=220684 RepID=UPI001F4065A9|nr:type VII secretion protein EssA [Neobacillus drentensis]ULT57353.1 type VII secretion protein EssA [Neobacillus drentensis]